MSDPKIKVVCASCKEPMGTKPCSPEQDGKTSHGMCPECFTEALKKLKPERKSMGKKRFEGTLEVDHDRGVVYFHDKEGHCLVRLEGLPIPNPEEAQIDIRLRSLVGGTEARDLEGHVMAAEVLGLPSHKVGDRLIRCGTAESKCPEDKAAIDGFLQNWKEEKKGR